MSRILDDLRAAYARAWVRVKGNMRVKTWFLWEVVLPTIFMASVIYAYYNLDAPRIFIGFVVVGTMMMNFWFNVLWGMGNVLYWEKETGNLEVFLLSDRPIYMLLLGMALGGMLNTGIRSLAILLIGILVFGADFNTGGLMPATIVFLLTLAALYSLGLMFSSLHLVYGRKGIRINEILGDPISFLSGQYYPISVFPTVLQALASLLPLTIGLDGVRRALLLGQGLGDLYIHILGLGIMVMILLPLGIWVLNHMVEKGRRDGRLIMRWL